MKTPKLSKMTDADLKRVFDEREDALERLDDLMAAARRYIKAHDSLVYRFQYAADSEEYGEAYRSLDALVD